MQSYMQREVSTYHESQQTVKEWSIRKSLQAEVEAMRRLHLAQQARIVTLQKKIEDNHIEKEAKQREGGFSLRTSPLLLPTRQTFDATLPRIQRLGTGVLEYPSAAMQGIKAA